MSLQPWFKSNNWYNFYKNNAELHISNLHLVQLQCSSFMMVGDPFDTFTNLAHEEGVFLLLVAPNQWVLQVFHQADIVGGTFSKSAKFMVSLSGFESKAVPVKIEVDTSIVDVEEEVPSWDLLAEANVHTTEQFMALTSFEPFQF